MGIIPFDYNAFVARYPEFTPVGPTLLGLYFNDANIYCRNDTCNPAFASGVLPNLLNMVTAHIAWLSAPRDAAGNPAASGTPPPSLVGRIASAGEGSVNVSTEYDSSGSPSEAWFIQTPYGAAFWQASAAFRTARYRANPTYVPSGAYPGFGPYGGRRWR